MQKPNSRFMSDQNLCQETPVLLTRTEVRRFLRVNEKTIDCWLRERKLEQLPDLNQLSAEVMIALRDEGLRDRFQRNIADRGGVDLVVENLPVVARFQLLKLMARMPREGDRSQMRIGSSMRPLRVGRRRRTICRSKRPATAMARWETSLQSSRKASAQSGTRAKAHRLGRMRPSQFRGGSPARGTKSRLSLGSGYCPQTVDKLFPPKQGKRRRKRKTVDRSPDDLSAVQAIVEASDSAEAVESCWGDEMLALVRDVAESVAEEVEEHLEDEQMTLPEKDEVWLALDEIVDPDVLQGTAQSLFAADGDERGVASGDAEVIEVELDEDRDGELIGYVVENEADEVAAESSEELAVDVDDEPTETAEDKALASPFETEAGAPVDGCLELELGPEDWLPGEEMVQALSNSPVFASAESDPLDEDSEEYKRMCREVSESPAPTEIEINELFTPLTADQVATQSEMNEFISEEAAALYRLEDHISLIEETSAKHREEEFAELAELRADIAATWSQEAAIIETVGSIEADVRHLKREAKATRKSAGSALSVSRRTQSELRRRLTRSGVIRTGVDVAGLLPITAGVLVTSWAMTIYLKTGDLRMALGGLVLVNVLACASLLHGKTGRYFW